MTTMFNTGEYTHALVLIAALRKVAKFNLEGKTIDQAMLLVANEIENGLNQRLAGKTKLITHKDLENLNFIGEKE